MPHKDPEERRRYFREYHLKNKAKKNAASKKHFKDNRAHYKSKMASYYLETKDNKRRDYIEAKRLNIQEYDRKRHRNKLIKKYGLDPAEVPEVLECEICSSTVRVAFDHNHNTGGFRGFLCYRCNLALGYVGDSEDILLALVTYLQQKG